MNAVILAGGFGSRLKPLTEEIIKPMLPLSNTPMIDYTMSHLADFGVRDFVFTLSYKPEQIIEWAIGYRHAVCHFSLETVPLGTLGGVKAAESFLDDTFIVMSGDALEDIDLNAMTHKHFTSNADITMAVKPVQNTSLYGVVELDSWGTVKGFTEKPPLGTEKSNLVNCGVYIVNKNVLSLVPKSEKFDFSKDFFPILLERGKISAYIHEGYWCDIGDIKSYYNANFDVMHGGFFDKFTNNLRDEYESQKIGVVNSSLASPSAIINGNISNCIIGRGSKITSNAVLENCIVLDNVKVTGRHFDSIIGNDFCININSFDNKFDNLQNSSQILNLFL